MRGTGRAGIGLTLLLFAAVAMPTVPASARERLLRCATSPVAMRAGHHLQHFAQHRFYAPTHSAMFFSHEGSACRWKAAHRRRG